MCTCKRVRESEKQKEVSRKGKWKRLSGEEKEKETEKMSMKERE